MNAFDQQASFDRAQRAYDHQTDDDGCSTESKAEAEAERADRQRDADIDRQMGL